MSRSPCVPSTAPLTLTLPKTSGMCVKVAVQSKSRVACTRGRQCWWEPSSTGLHSACTKQAESTLWVQHAAVAWTPCCSTAAHVQQLCALTSAAAAKEGPLHHSWPRVPPRSRSAHNAQHVYSNQALRTPKIWGPLAPTSTQRQNMLLSCCWSAPTRVTAQQNATATARVCPCLSFLDAGQ
jgi:hypothetical protein